MDNLTESMMIMISLIALFSVVLFAVLNIYLIKRNGFYINMNCWFCNQCSRVLYSKRNSFVCTICLQYNGFTKDGGYNKVIKEQHDTSAVLNKTSDKTELNSNGLCTYCNNNQRLKVKQLASFTPLNEKNYNIEVEHFRKQLEKSYKLCKKCETILKTTLNNQQSWIFGTNLKNYVNKGQSKLKKIADFDRLKYIRHFLVILTIAVYCYALKIRIGYPTSKDIENVLPKHFQLYTVWMKDSFLNVINGTMDKSFKKMIRVTSVKLENDYLFVVTSLGLFLQLILTFFEKTAKTLWKINNTLGWIFLFGTSVTSLSNDNSFYFKILQVFTCSALLYSYIFINASNTNLKTTYKFKKIKTSPDFSEFNSNFKTVYPDIHCHKYYCSSIDNNLFQNNLHLPVMNNFNTARSTSFFNGSNNTSNNSLHKDLHTSLDNLHLSSSDNRSQSCMSPVFSINSQRRQVLSPPKLKNITQNSWTAGGFWKNDLNNTFPVSSESFQPSRSSSQTSGFVSNNAFQSSPPSREESICGDVERNSVLSEPPYQNLFPATFDNKMGQHLYYRADNNTFYPLLTSNNVLFLHSTLPHCGYSNFSVSSFQTKGNVNSPVFVVDKPRSSLFKNVQFDANYQKPRI